MPSPSLRKMARSVPILEAKKMASVPISEAKKVTAKKARVEGAGTAKKGRRGFIKLLRKDQNPRVSMKMVLS